MGRLRIGEEKKRKKDRRKIPQDENIMACPIPYHHHNRFPALFPAPSG